MRDDILRSVLESQPGEYVAVAAKHRGRWSDYVTDSIDDAIRWLRERPRGSDLYWCPTKFNRRRRVKEAAAGTRFLWADLDNLDPDDLDPSPSILWQSSPGRYQCLWKLDKELPPDQAERLNRNLTYHVGADKSGWDLTQVLRVPGTRNYKYPGAPRGKLLHNDEKVISSDLGLPEPEESWLTGRSWREALSRNLTKIPPKTRRLLTAPTATKGKRSDVLWRLVHELTAADVDPEDIEILLRGSVWNKYRGRRDELKRLRLEIAAALENRIKRMEVDEDPLAKSSRAREVVRLPHSVLRAQVAGSHAWMVKDWWTRGSRGMIAGEPKSFKSFLAQDLALSVASGKPFLDRFPVLTPGPVLMIQAENAEWIINDRAEKIELSKGLTGRVEFPHVEFPPELPIEYINNQVLNLLDPVDRELIEEHIAEVKPVLTILDPLYLLFSGDVNSAQELNPVLTWLMDVNVRHKTSIIIVHHMGKAKQGTTRRGGQRMLGSTTLHGWTESAWYIDVKTAEDDPRPLLSIEREFRAAGVFPRYHLQLEVGEWGDPTYRVIHEPKVDRSQKTTVRRNIVAEILESEGKPMLPYQIFKHPMNDTLLSKRQVNAALEEAVKAGLVRRVGDAYEWIDN